MPNTTVNRVAKTRFPCWFEPRGTAAAVFDGVQRELRAGWTERRLHPVIVIDEAHALPDATLQHLHILANFDRDANPLLSLILVGLPELRDRLKLGVHRSLLTRIGTHVEIHRTTPDDTAAYVRNRLDDPGGVEAPAAARSAGCWPPGRVPPEANVDPMKSPARWGLGPHRLKITVWTA